MSEYKYNLQKSLYESKKARDILDEEFIEFLPKKRSISEFFNLYSTKFFDILTTTHSFFLSKSLEYVINWIHPKDLEIENLNNQLITIQREIDTVEKTHPIIANGWIVTPNPKDEWDNLNSIELYYMQSGILRKIKNSELFYLLKHNLRKSRIKNENIILEVDSSFINSIKFGKSIEIEEDIADSNYTINTYNG